MTERRDLTSPGDKQNKTTICKTDPKVEMGSKLNILKTKIKIKNKQDKIKHT